MTKGAIDSGFFVLGVTPTMNKSFLNTHQGEGAVSN